MSYYCTSFEQGRAEVSRSAAEEEEPRATVDAASTDATSVHDPFIFLSPVLETPTTRRNITQNSEIQWTKPDTPRRISTNRFSLCAILSIRRLLSPSRCLELW